MSLLMDALKQAEHAKRDKPQARERDADPQPRTAPATDIPALDATDRTETVQAVADTLPADISMSLSPLESSVQETQEPVELSLDSETTQPAQPVSNELCDEIPEAKRVAEITPLGEESSARKEVIQETAKPAAKLPDPAPAIAPTPADERITEPARTMTEATPLNPAAARVFAASNARQQAQRRRNLLGSISLIVLMLLALAAYHYWSSLSQTAPPPIPLALAPTEIPVATTDSKPTEIPVASTPVETTDNSSSRAPLFDAQARKENAVPVEKNSTTESIAPADQKQSGSQIRFHRSTRSSTLHENLGSAYQAYTENRLTTAAQQYAQVLSHEPGNRDALLGLAAIAIRNREDNKARAYYRGVLERNPGDSTALAGLLSLQREPGPQTVSDLKAMIQQQPQAAHLHFALANRYATEQRWPLAQQAYFEAQRLVPDNPDYAYNLAVSLEHLEQPQLALRYYQRALQLHQQQPGRLDSRVAQQRIDALSSREAP